MSAPFTENRCLLCGSSAYDAVCESPSQMHTTRELHRFVRCRDCDLVQLRPLVPVSQIGRYYDETYLPHRGASAWGRFAPIVEKSMAAVDRARVRRVLTATRLDSNSRVLDLGCGRPTFLRTLRNQTGATAVGIDFAEEAWRHEPERWRDLQLHQGTLDSVTLAGKFDAITLWHALEHEYDPLDTLRRLKSLTKPGATLIVEVPNEDSLTRRIHGEHWAGFHTPRHTAAYTPATLAKLLDRAGWRVERQLKFGTMDPYVLWWLGRQERLGRSVRIDLSDRFVPFVLGKIATLPLTLLQRWISLGIQTAIARPA
jgi:2-polyprenyl-3-methyl-5-hydroxy-6-metoxy-1,4-benzoquinol methylase